MSGSGFRVIILGLLGENKLLTSFFCLKKGSF